MRIMLLLAGLVLCSCSRDDSQSGAGSNAKRLSTDETRQVAMHVLLNRYPNAEITSETSDGQSARYRFKTNGVTVPSVVVVDRNAGKAHFEKANQ
ncbi:MAG: hypothetical protein QM813_03695 [Verrucomicrobiota bacterium]